MKTIWLTQTEPTVNAIADDLASDFDAVKIQPVTEVLLTPFADWQTQVQQVKSADWVILTSGHAIRTWFAHCPQRLEQKVAVMGKTSADLIALQGIENVLYPKSGQEGTEGLLALLLDQMKPGSRLAVITGENRRGVLELKLSALGHHVDLLPIYKILPVFNNLKSLALTLAPKDWLVVASKQTLDLIIAGLLDNNKKHLIYECFWLTVSERLAQSLVKQFPEAQVKIAQSPSAKSIHSCLKSCYARS